MRFSASHLYFVEMKNTHDMFGTRSNVDVLIQNSDEARKIRSDTTNPGDVGLFIHTISVVIGRTLFGGVESLHVELTPP